MIYYFPGFFCLVWRVLTLGAKCFGASEVMAHYSLDLPVRCVSSAVLMKKSPANLAELSGKKRITLNKRRQQN
jgi:hypothetical protein